MNFPLIDHIDDLLPHISGKPEIRVMDQDNGTKVVCYMVNNDETFDNAFAKECRGITFDSTGKLICRPLHKFFNVNENESVRVENLRGRKIDRVMDKRDGSMITPTLVRRGDSLTIRCKSKKSFESDVAVHAQNFILANDNYREFCEVMLDAGLTPVFEWTSRKSRIVIDYGDTDVLTLLHVRENNTGVYVRSEALRDLCATPYHIPLVESHRWPSTVSIDALLDKAQTEQGIEGWVVQFEDGDMVKIKTKWYLDLHHVVTFLRERDIAEMVVDETLDDVKSVFKEQGLSLDRIHEIEKSVTDIIVGIRDEVESLVESSSSMDRKSFAIAHRDHDYFGLAINRFIGKEPDYLDFFRKNVLRERFSLDQI